MSALLGLFAKRSIENPEIPLTAENILSYFGGEASDAGVSVSETSAMRFSAVFGSIRIRAEGIGVMPIKVYKVDADGNKQEARDEPVYELLHDRPNPEMSPSTFKKTMQASIDGWGSGRAWIEHDGKGQVKAFWPLRPDWTTVVRKRGTQALAFKSRLRRDDDERIFDAAEVLNIPGLGLDGISGYRVLSDLAKQTIGTELARKQFLARFFKNGAWHAGGLKLPGTIDRDGRKELREELREKHGGALNAFNPMILQQGMEWFEAGIPTEDAMMVDLGTANVRDIARYYRVPLHMLADMEKGASFASIAEVSLEFLTYTLGDPITAWQEEINYKALEPGFVAEFVTDALLRGDPAAAAERDRTLIEVGVMSVNEVRKRRNLNPIKGGDVHIQPLNMAPLGEPAPKPKPKPDPEENAADLIVDAHYPLLREAAERVVRLEVDRARRQSKKPASEFETWALSFFEDQRAFACSSLRSVASTIVHLLPLDLSPGERAEVAIKLVDAFVKGELEASREKLVEARHRGELDALLGRWDTDRPVEMAETLVEKIKEIAA